MRRKALDKLLTMVGGLLTIVLIAAGGLLMWGYSFANSQVHSQLAAQRIYFPAKDSPSLQNPLIKPYLTPYAGQQLLNGRQAEVWADHYIAVHLQEIGGGKTYAEVSAAALADPSNKALATEAQTLFQGETLRGTLLTAYAFWMFGQIAEWSAIAMFIGAALMLILTILGWTQYKKRDPEHIVI